MDDAIRVPIADIFQTKKRRKREVNSTDYADDYDFWSGEYDEYSEENEIVSTEKRIDFEKQYSSSDDKRRPTTSKKEICEGELETKGKKRGRGKAIKKVASPYLSF